MGNPIKLQVLNLKPLTNKLEYEEIEQPKMAPVLVFPGVFVVFRNCSVVVLFWPSFVFSTCPFYNKKKK